jgi:hypothetical protein
VSASFIRIPLVPGRYGLDPPIGSRIRAEAMEFFFELGNRDGCALFSVQRLADCGEVER